MTNLIQVDIDGEVVYFEAEPTYGSEEATSVEERLERAREGFERAKATVTTVTKGMIGAIRAMEDQLAPDEVGLEFGIKFNAEGKAIVASVGGEATLKVTLKYTPLKEREHA